MQHRRGRTVKPESHPPLEPPVWTPKLPPVAACRLGAHPDSESLWHGTTSPQQKQDGVVDKLATSQSAGSAECENINFARLRDSRITSAHTCQISPTPNALYQNQHTEYSHVLLRDMKKKDQNRPPDKANLHSKDMVVREELSETQEFQTSQRIPGMYICQAIWLRPDLSE